MAGISKEEKLHCEEQLERLNREIAETEKLLSLYDGPIITGESKSMIKGLMEQQLANMERQRDYFVDRLEQAE